MTEARCPFCMELVRGETEAMAYVAFVDHLDEHANLIGIIPGDIVVNFRRPELDPREVVEVGEDWLTLRLAGRESTRFRLANYRHWGDPEDEEPAR